MIGMNLPPIDCNTLITIGHQHMRQILMLTYMGVVRQNPGLKICGSHSEPY